jgi:hypothetical protein
MNHKKLVSKNLMGHWPKIKKNQHWISN